MSGSKLLLTDNNYQSYQSLTNKKKYLWKKIAQIGNYCQFKHQRCELVELTSNNQIEWIDGKNLEVRKNSFGYLYILIKTLIFADINTKNNIRNEIYQTMPIHRPCIVAKLMQRLQETQGNVKNTI